MPSNQYSPTAEQPYQPTVAPEIIQPTPSPVAPQNPAPTGIQAAGNISHVGAVAGIADNILRGFMQGRAQRDARQAMTTKRQTDIMEASYNSAASQLLQMHRDGVDPNSTEYKQAKDAVDGSFAAKNAYYAQHVLAGDQKPKKGKKGEQEPTSIGEMVQSKDPAVQAKGWLLLQQKAGPPVYHQIASSSTPQAQQARATANTQSSTAQSDANTKNALAKMAEQITNLSVKPNPTDEEKKQLEGLKGQYTNLRDTLNPPKTPVGGTHRFSDDGKEQYEVDVEGREIPNTRRPRSTAATKDVRSWKKINGKITSFLIDPKTNQEIPGTENPDILPPASMEGKITEGYHYWVDSDGNLQRTADTRVTRPLAPGGTGTPPTSSGSLPGPGAASGGGQGSASTAPQAHPHSGGSTSTIPKTIEIGHKGTPQETAAKKQADKLDTVAREAMARANKPTAIGDQGLVLDWVRTQVAGAGRITITEINQAYKAGSLDTRAKNMYERFVNGKLDPAFRRQMVDDIVASAKAARAEANTYDKPKTVRMKAPDGTVQDVESDQVDHYTKLGATVVKDK